jgi:hypothetical protein
MFTFYQICTKRITNVKLKRSVERAFPKEKARGHEEGGRREEEMGRACTHTHTHSITNKGAMFG